MSFIINKKIAYLPDANKIYEKDLEKFVAFSKKIKQPIKVLGKITNNKDVNFT